MAIAVTVFGNVKYANNKVKAFSENFILTSQANVWKIASDVFRFMEKPWLKTSSKNTEESVVIWAWPSRVLHF